MENTTENKMGVMPVGKLLVQISLPMMISMFVQALYNIVDSIFVAQISENALTAVSLAFPILRREHSPYNSIPKTALSSRLKSMTLWDARSCRKTFTLPMAITASPYKSAYPLDCICSDSTIIQNVL